MLKTHLKSFICVLILGTLSPIQSLYGEDFKIKKNEYYLIIDRNYMNSIVNNTEQLNFTSCEGPFTEVEEIRKEFESLLNQPVEIKENEEMSADIATEDSAGTVPLPPAGRTSQSMSDLLRNIEGPMNLSPEIPPTAEIPATDLDLIKRQIASNWKIPAGAKDIKDLYVDIRTVLNPDGSVRSAEVTKTSTPISDPYMQAIANSAVKAVKAASPLAIHPKDAERFKTLIIRFDPKSIL